MSCPSCKQPIDQTYYYCPNCGKQLRRDAPLSLSFGKQISLYTLSFLLPPFGLWLAFRYLMQEGLGSKIIGFIATALTIVSLVILTFEVRLLIDLLTEFGPLMTTVLQLI